VTGISSITTGLPVVPLAMPDEWLGHWLLRIADRYGLPVATFVHRITAAPDHVRRFNWLRPAEWEPRRWLALARAVHVDVGIAQSMQALVIPMADRTQTGFCPKCVLCGNAIFWRRSWMEATAVWCSDHGCPLVAYRTLSELSSRSYRAAHAVLSTRAGSLWSDSSGARWTHELARDAGHLFGLAGLHLTHIRLLEQVLVALVWLVQDTDNAPDLARAIGAPSPEVLVEPNFPRRINTAKPVIGQIRSLAHRAWLLGTAARMLGPRCAGDAFLRKTLIDRDTLRSLVFGRLYAFQLADLVMLIRHVATAGDICPWPEADRWATPRSGTEWFRRRDPE
jgi:TniQ